MIRIPVTRGVLVRCALCAFAAFALFAPFAQARADSSHAAFTALVEQYVAESEARNPLFADGIGIHTYDDQLPDLSPAGQQANDAWEACWRHLRPPSRLR